MLSTNPFIVLSYVSGPAILTNAAALLLLSTSNRFARAIDRSRQLVGDIQTLSAAGRTELTIAARRVKLIARTMSSLYLSAASFAVATLMSVLGAVLAEALGRPATDIPIIVALVCGLIGFAAFVTGAVGLVIESRLAVRALTHETDEALALLAKTTAEGSPYRNASRPKRRFRCDRAIVLFHLQPNVKSAATRWTCPISIVRSGNDISARLPISGRRHECRNRARPAPKSHIADPDIVLCSAAERGRKSPLFGERPWLKSEAANGSARRRN